MWVLRFFGRLEPINLVKNGYNQSFRQRYVPINHRIQDLCYDFLPEHRMNAGYKSCLPDDAQEIYEPFGMDLNNFIVPTNKKH